MRTNSRSIGSREYAAVEQSKSTTQMSPRITQASCPLLVTAAADTSLRPTLWCRRMTYGFAANVHAVVLLYLLSRNLAVQEVPPEGGAVALTRVSEPAASRRHDPEMLAAPDMAAVLAGNFFHRAVVAFQEQGGETAVAAAVKTAWREYRAVAAHIHGRALG